MPNPKDTPKELTKEAMAFLESYRELLNYYGIFGVPILPLDERQRPHFPNCHKVHIECANKAIDEARNLIADHLLESKARARHKDFRDYTEWL